MNDQFITFKTAKLAKEKGCDIRTQYYYTKEGYERIGVNGFYNDQILNLSYVARYTQTTLHKWLRKIHGMIILPFIADNGDGDWWITYRIWSVNDEDYIYESDYSTAFDDFDDALEAGLQEVLKII